MIFIITLSLAYYTCSYYLDQYIGILLANLGSDSGGLTIEKQQQTKQLIGVVLATLDNIATVLLVLWI